MQEDAQKKKMRILGISCYYHDAAAALLEDGKIIAAAQEERFTRKKHDEEFPERAVQFCLEKAGIEAKDLDYVVFYDKPIATFDRLLQTFFNTWPKGWSLFIPAMRVWLTKKLWIEGKIAKKLGREDPIYFTEHHYSHAASSYFASPFDDAVVVTMDGVGESDTATIGYGKGNELVLTHSINFPHSLGLLYSAITYYLGFKVNSAEYKVMGLAPYGNPEKYYEQMKKLIEIKEDGSFVLNRKYFAYEYGLRMTNWRINKLFGGAPRQPEAELEQKHKDIAAALQKVTEEIVLKIVAHAQKLHPSKNLCLAGGVALNCVANGKILESGLFNDIYIQPAAGDAGGAVGAAAYMYYSVLKNKKEGSAMPGVYLGPNYSDSEIETLLEKTNREKCDGKLVYKKHTSDELLDFTAGQLATNAIVGWFQGKMEFGPRALGNRSILADARNKENWQRVNLKIKYRESFRPFAPAVMAEYAEKYFKLHNHESPYMLLVADVLNDEVPAVTHVDKSARVQTVSKENNKRFYDLLSVFNDKTNCPVLINTSFNVRGEPIVCSPEDAFHCFVNTEMDVLVLGSYSISKSDNTEITRLRDQENYLESFELD